MKILDHYVLQPLSSHLEILSLPICNARHFSNRERRVTPENKWPSNSFPVTHDRTVNSTRDEMSRTGPRSIFNDLPTDRSAAPKRVMCARTFSNRCCCAPESAGTKRGWFSQHDEDRPTTPFPRWFSLNSYLSFSHDLRSSLAKIVTMYHDLALRRSRELRTPAMRHYWRGTHASVTPRSVPWWANSCRVWGPLQQRVTTLRSSGEKERKRERERLPSLLALTTASHKLTCLPYLIKSDKRIIFTTET